MTGGRCSVPDCSGLVAAKGMCAPHYKAEAQIKRQKDERTERIAKARFKRAGPIPAEEMCTIPGCPRRRITRGLCRHHRERLPLPRFCSIADCQGRNYCRGLCKRHHSAYIARQAGLKPCVVRDCHRKPINRQMCKLHYDTWRTEQGMLAPCKIEGCPYTVAGQGMCHRHYGRWRRGTLQESVQPQGSVS
jgi:hypothetical protein